MKASETYTIVSISKTNICDINLPNQPFLILGRIVPQFNGKAWSFSEVLFENQYEFKFPDDEVDYEQYIDNKNKITYLLYMNGTCTGQIRLRSNWNKFCYIEDLAVSPEYRRKGAAKLLLAHAENWAKERSLCGFMLEAQDFNLAACRLYHKLGFVIGSVDNMLYYNTSNKHDLAIFWYKIF